MTDSGNVHMQLKYVAVLINQLIIPSTFVDSVKDPTIFTDIIGHDYCIFRQLTSLPKLFAQKECLPALHLTYPYI